MTVPRLSRVVARAPTARSWLDLRGLQRTRGLSTLAVLASCVAHATVCGCWVWWAHQQALLAPSAGTPIAVTILETPPPPPPPAPEPEPAPAILPPEPPALPPPPEPLPAADPMPLEATPAVASEPPAPAPVPPREEIAPPAPEPVPVAPGDDGASAAYWLQVRAEIARSLRLPHTGSLSTSIAVRLAGAPDRFIVVAPPPGGDPLARSVRRAAEGVARRLGPIPTGTVSEAHWNIVIKPTGKGIPP